MFGELSPGNSLSESTSSVSSEEYYDDSIDQRKIGIGKWCGRPHLCDVICLECREREKEFQKEKRRKECLKWQREARKERKERERLKQEEIKAIREKEERKQRRLPDIWHG